MLRRSHLILPVVLALGALVQSLVHAHPLDPYHHTRDCQEGTIAPADPAEDPQAPRHSHRACAPCSAPVAQTIPQLTAIQPPTWLGQLPAEVVPAPPTCESRRGIELRGPPSA